MDVSKDTLREKWVSVRGTPTYILCQGWTKDHDTIIIIIPGLCYVLHFIYLIIQIWLLLIVFFGCRPGFCDRPASCVRSYCPATCCTSLGHCRIISIQVWSHVLPICINGVLLHQSSVLQTVADREPCCRFIIMSSNKVWAHFEETLWQIVLVVTSNEVTLRRAGLVLRWVTIRSHTVLVFNQTTPSTKPGHPFVGRRNEHWWWSRPPLGKKWQVLCYSRPWSVKGAGC